MAERPKRALILGCASGIGAEGALILAEWGWSLALVDIAGEKLRAVAEKTGAAAAILADAADQTQLSDAVQQGIRALGGVDAVWSNVGVQTAGSVEEATVEELDACYTLNVRAHFIVAQHAIPALRREHGGAFLITASNAGLIADTHFVAYSATKAATVALAKLLARDHAEDNIRVNALCPGWVDTPFNTPVWAQYGGRDEFLKQVPRLVPIGRIASAREVARVACRLLSEESSFITGQALVIDGGELLV